MQTTHVKFVMAGEMSNGCHGNVNWDVIMSCIKGLFLSSLPLWLPDMWQSRYTFTLSFLFYFQVLNVNNCSKYICTFRQEAVFLLPVSDPWAYIWIVCVLFLLIKTNVMFTPQRNYETWIITQKFQDMLIKS